MVDGVTMFTPIEGYVLKFKRVNEALDPSQPPSYVKAFINFLHSPQIPEPSCEFSAEEVRRVIDERSSTDVFDIPFVVGQYIDAVTDKSSENAMKFDVMVSSDFYAKYLADKNVDIYRRLLVSKACDAIKDMHHIQINHWEAIVLNRRSMGSKAETQELILYKSSRSMIKEVEKPKETMEEKKPMVTVIDSTKEYTAKTTQRDLEYPDIYSTLQNERVRVRIIDGCNLEIRIKVDSFEGLRLEMSRDRVHLRNRRQSIADFHLCVLIEKRRATTKVHEERNILEIIAPIQVPRIEI